MAIRFPVFILAYDRLVIINDTLTRTGERRRRPSHPAPSNSQSLRTVLVPKSFKCNRVSNLY